MKPFDLYRRRLIPNECVLLENDRMISFEEHKLVTVWSALRPKKNLHHGISVFFFDDGIKLSKFYREDNSLVYWYIDIIRADLCYGPVSFDRPYDIGYENYALPKELSEAKKEELLSPVETAARLYHRSSIRISDAARAFDPVPAFIVTDLLADILIYPDGFVKVVDLDEISDAFEKGMLTQKTVCETLRIVNRTLRQIYDGSFIQKQDYLKSFE